VRIVLHVFDAELQGRMEGDTITGTFVKHYAPETNLPFTATWNITDRFERSAEAITDFSGKYEVVFYSPKDTTQAVGVFDQKGNEVTGTFLTTTGDYRYLQGIVSNDTMLLSTFDGNHAYLFSAKKQNDSTLTGEFWSGGTSHKTWVAKKTESALLPNPESLTYLKGGYETIAFAFPDVNGDTVSLNNEKYKNKVVILQLFGTWCPNCMDEIKFLAPWYEQNKERGVEIIGLAYERKADFDYATERVKKMQAKWNVGYDFVIAGVNDKAKAAETLPALNRVVAFPTTIFIGKDGKVKHIHTGFEGPGTGIYHELFKQRFNEIVNELLNENLTSKKK